MNLILYDESRTVVEVIGVQTPVVNNNNVQWEDGSIQGINLPFIIVEDQVGMGDVLSDEMISKDKKSNYLKKDLEKENEELRSRVDSVEFATITLMDFM